MKKTVNKIIQWHYEVPRPVTDKEVKDELVNLRRKAKKGSLDNRDSDLYAELEVRGMITPREAL